MANTTSLKKSKFSLNYYYYYYLRRVFGFVQQMSYNWRPYQLRRFHVLFGWLHAPWCVCVCVCVYRICEGGGGWKSRSLRCSGELKRTTFIFDDPKKENVPFLGGGGRVCVSDSPGKHLISITTTTSLIFPLCLISCVCVVIFFSLSFSKEIVKSL